jgi:hypothetical protein
MVQRSFGLSAEGVASNAQTMREGQNDAAVLRLGRNLAQPRLA